MPGRILALAALSSLTVATLTVTAGPAWAQGVEERQDTRRQNGAKLTQEQGASAAEDSADDANRLHDSYQPKGVELGSFLLLPKIEVDEKYNSNVFAAQDNVQQDFITYIRPEMKLRSRFAQHELNFQARVEQQLYARFEDDNRTDGSFSADGRYDFSSTTEGRGYFQLYSTHEDRSSPDDVNGKNPAQIYGSEGRLSGKHKAGSFTFEGDAGAERKKYGSVEMTNAADFSNGDRNRWEYTSRQRAGYEMFPGYSAIVELGENMHEFDRDQDRNGYNRNSQGYRAETGFAVDVSNLIRGDFLMGYMYQDYEDGRLNDPSGLSFRATFNWTPSKMTIVVPSLERSVQDTTTSKAAALVRSELGLTVRHELQRNIILTGITSVAMEEMEGVSNHDDMLYTAKGRVTYAFTPELYVGGELGWQRRDAEAANSDMTQMTSMVRVGVQY